MLCSARDKTQELENTKQVFHHWAIPSALYKHVKELVTTTSDYKLLS
jgi:hypothetical protein